MKGTLSRGERTAGDSRLPSSWDRRVRVRPAAVAEWQCEVGPALPASWPEAAATTSTRAWVRKKGSRFSHLQVLL